MEWGRFVLLGLPLHIREEEAILGRIFPVDDDSMLQGFAARHRASRTTAQQRMRAWMQSLVV